MQINILRILVIMSALLAYTLTCRCASASGSMHHGDAADNENTMEPPSSGEHYDGGKHSPAILNYLEIQEALASDSLEGVAEAGQALAGATRERATKVCAQAEVLAKAADISAARTVFRALSDAMIAEVEAGKFSGAEIYLAHCPMAKASWVQAGKGIRNPYYGASMLKCGVIKPRREMERK